MQHTEERFLKTACAGRDKDAQRKALVRLLELAHSDSTDSKKFAAANIKNYITIFPDLEDDAINAIYDLCEDQASIVRIQGYIAVAAVSKQDVKWVKRNADVLVQLLQSDEPDELFYIRKGLEEHLDLAPSVTIGVLCDQITATEEPIDEEDQLIRDRLRTLVLEFLVEKMKKILLIMKDGPGSDPERILVEGLLKTIPRSGPADVRTIVKDIILCLPSYQYRSPPGQTVLEAVLDEARQAVLQELRDDEGQNSLEKTRLYLDLAGVVAGTASRVLPLLEFYFIFVVQSIKSLTPETQRFVIDEISTLLNSYSDIDRSSDATAARKLATDTSLIKALADNESPQPREWEAFRSILQACVKGQDHSSQWATSPEVLEPLEKIKKAAQSQQETLDADYLQHIQDLTRSIIQPNENGSPNSHASGDSRKPLKRKHDLDPGSRHGTPPTRRDRQSKPTEEVLPPRSPKRSKREESEEGQPSLLSRLNPGNGSSSGANTPQRWPERPMQLPASLPKKPDVPMPALDHDEGAPPASGLSIKGAASRSADGSYEHGRKSRYPESRGGGGGGESLLDRLHGEDRNSGRKREDDSSRHQSRSRGGQRKKR